MAIPNRPTDKESFRDEARLRLREMNPDQARDRSVQICEHLAAWLERHPGTKSIASFCALRGEPDLGALPPRLPLVRWHYPLVHADCSLSLHLVEDPQTLKPGAFGILEPDQHLHPPVPPADIDLILCPGLAFAEDGSRLGRGKGYYDRLLALLPPQAPRIGVFFHQQGQPALPTENHDQRMTHLLSEEGLVCI